MRGALVAVAPGERALRAELGAEDEVARSEARAAAVEVPQEVERAVLRSCRGQRVGRLVGSAKERVLPAIPVASRVRGAAAVADPGLELAAVAAAREEIVHHRAPVAEEAVGMEAEGDPSPLPHALRERIDRRSAVTRAHVAARPLGPRLHVSDRPALRGHRTSSTAGRMLSLAAREA